MGKRCARCGETKSSSDFSVGSDGKGKGRKKADCYCRPCRAEYGREHYLRNRQDYIDKAGIRTRRMVEQRMRYVVEYLRQSQCVDCGERDILVLEFDHVRDKEFGIANGIRSRKWESVLEEIKKCDVVCANCHRRRTAKRAGFLRAALADLERQLTLSGVSARQPRETRPVDKRRAGEGN